jgi:hypothetical protein
MALRRCLVIMPFDPSFDPVYSMIRRAVLSGAGGDTICQRLDELAAPGRMSEALVDALSAADFCVADLTGANPNVMWEVGYAMAMRKPVVFVTQDAESLPFDIRDMRTIEYDPRGPEAKLADGVSTAVRAVAEGEVSLFASWKRRQSLRADGYALPLHLIDDDGSVLPQGHSGGWHQTLSNVLLKIESHDVHLRGSYTLQSYEEVRMQGRIEGAGVLVRGRVYLTYRIDDEERGQHLNGVLMLKVPQWGDLTGVYLAESYSPGADTILGSVTLKRAENAGLAGGAP